MESQGMSPQYVTKLIGEIGFLKADGIYKEMIIQEIREENQVLTKALEEAHTKLEALSQVDPYLMDDDEIDKSFVCE